MLQQTVNSGSSMVMGPVIWHGVVGGQEWEEGRYQWQVLHECPIPLSGLDPPPQIHSDLHHYNSRHKGLVSAEEHTSIVLLVSSIRQLTLLNHSL